MAPRHCFRGDTLPCLAPIILATSFTFFSVFTSSFGPFIKEIVKNKKFVSTYLLLYFLKLVYFLKSDYFWLRYSTPLYCLFQLIFCSWGGLWLGGFTHFLNDTPILLTKKDWKLHNDMTTYKDYFCHTAHMKGMWWFIMWAWKLNFMVIRRVSYLLY